MDYMKYLVPYKGVCYVCKSTTAPFFCRCHMVSYCTLSHENEHRPEHKEICDAVMVLLKGKEHINTEEITSEQWLSLKLYYMHSVSSILGRELRMEEKQMFMFLEACAICHRQDSLSRCTKCLCVMYCSAHRSYTPNYEHDCKSLKLAFELDKLAPEWVGTYGYVDIYKDLTEEKNFTNMAQFLTDHSRSGLYEGITDHSVIISQSDFVTEPLTLYFTMEKLNYVPSSNNILIHIIAESYRDIRSLESWQILLRLMPSLPQSLIIVAIGPAIKHDDHRVIRYHDQSSNKPKMLMLNTSAMSYQTYVRTGNLQKPDFIIGFHASICNYNYAPNLFKETTISWVPLIPALVEQNCPCILTFGKQDVKNEFMRIERTKHVYWGENPFKSERPYREFRTERVCYRNEYLIIFENLTSASIFVTNNSCCLLV